jgi:hypothetical protein
MTTKNSAIALTAAAAIVMLSSVGQAQTPNQADFDACNREAQMRATNPAASPGGTSGTTGVTPTPPPTSSPSGGAAASPSTSPSTGGTTGGMSSSPSTGAPALPGSGLTGISAAGQSDPAYQQAYRDCLKRRGF